MWFVGDTLYVRGFIDGYNANDINRLVNLVVARDIPVFREIAGSHAFYFAGTRPADLERALQRWLTLHASANVPSSAGMRWLTWQQCTVALKALMLEDAAPADAPGAP